MAGLTARSRRAGAVPWSALLLGLTALASGLSAALLYRARQEAPPPALEGADALVAEAARQLEAGDAAAAALRYGEALDLAPERVDALVGRARARARAGQEPLLVREDLERALTLAPRDPGALRAMAELRLARGDLRGAREALDRALEAVPATTEAAAAPAHAQVDAIADVRLRLEEAVRLEQATIDRADALLAAFDGPAALGSLEAALAAAPESAALLATLSRVQADLGRFDDALKTALEAERLDPSRALATSQLDALRLLVSAPAPGAAPPLDRWAPALGGVWREDAGVLTGQGQGLGEFELAMLLADAPPSSASATVTVELSLVSGDPGAYAGVVVAARGRDDFYLVYVFHDRGYARSSIAPAELDEHRRRAGAWPKFVRVARLHEGRWQHRSTQPAEFPDAGWVSLTVELRGAELTPIVAGKRGETVRLDRPLDGRAGLAKFYDTTARWRGFEVRQ